MRNTGNLMPRPLVKICGLTDPENAVQCAQEAADIIGLIFFPGSPRHVTQTRAKSVVKALPAHVPAWGVFVNETLKTILETAAACGLKGVQLHGQEPPELIHALKAHHLTVTKAVFASRSPGLNTIPMYSQSDYILVECGLGTLPGGNARTWDYGLARKTALHHPVFLAGGLSCENIEQAVTSVAPAGVDLSSGVESAPGVKDVLKVRQLIRRVRTIPENR
jgi:phosphoribosylanthranilate isomerase/indole-3-glycerol phosphate synthase/phosphoribosylanthranilate isomerase